jgi:hypothetical protein
MPACTQDIVILQVVFLISVSLFSSPAGQTTNLSKNEYIGIAVGGAAFLTIVWTLLFIPCGICCCCVVMHRRKRDGINQRVAYNNLYADGKQVTFVNNSHSKNPAYGSPVYQGSNSYTAGTSNTFSTFVPAYREAPVINSQIGYTKTSFTVQPNQINQVIQDGPPVTGQVSSSSISQPVYTATVGSKRESIGSYSNPTFASTSVRTSFVAEPGVELRKTSFVAEPSTTTTVTTTEETTEERTEEYETVKTEFRKSIIKT